MKEKKLYTRTRTVRTAYRTRHSRRAWWGHVGSAAAATAGDDYGDDDYDELVGCALCCGVQYIRVRRRARRRAASVVSASAACVRVRVYQLSVAPRVVESSLLLLLLLLVPRLRASARAFRFVSVIRVHNIYIIIYNIIGVYQPFE